MTSDSDDLEEALRQNLELTRALAAEIAKAETARQRGMAYRLGWVLYWTCIVIAGGWAAFTVGAITTSFALEDIRLGQWIVALGPPLLIYGLGRAFSYVLSGE